MGLLSSIKHKLATATQAGSVDFYKSEEVSLDSNFSDGTIICTRVGKMVTISLKEAFANHATGVSASTNAGLIPAAYRPSTDKFNCYSTGLGGTNEIRIHPNGTLTTQYYNTTFGTSSRSNTVEGFSISYCIG